MPALQPPTPVDHQAFCDLANGWVEQLLRREIARARAKGLLTEGAPDRRPSPAEASAGAAAAARALQQGLAAARAAGVVLPFQRLCGELELDSEESCLLLIAIAVATEPRVRRLLGELQADADGARINVGVALGLLVSDDPGGVPPWRLLAPDGRLRSLQLLALTGGAGGVSLTSRFLSVPDPVAVYATAGELWLDERLSVVARLDEPTVGWDALRWPAEAKRLLRRRLGLATDRAGEPIAVLLRGSVGSGRKAIALATCRELHRKLLILDAERLPGDEEGALHALRVAVRDARLNQALLYIENAEALRRDTTPGAARLRALRAVMPLYGRLLFMATERNERIDAEDALDVAAIDVPALGAAERAELWRTVLGPALDPDGAHVAHLVAQLPVNPGDILGVRGDVAALGRVSGGLLDRRELTRLVLDRSRHNLRALAHEVQIDHGLEDVVLPQPVLDRCQQIVELVERNALLRETWGLGAKLLPHRGVSALFSGPPGTGKTLMAGVLGRLLGLDVYRIDTALIVSKWVGETEKNLGRLFSEAQRTRAVLVFDEADALFARRTSVMTSVDRYGNAQVNYLLQLMEGFDGVVILTTNLHGAIDEAFLRRIQVHVRFPEPTAEDRHAIWRRMIPPQVAFESDVDLALIARKYALSPGLIRNATVRACLLASRRNPDVPRIAMADLVRAVLEEEGLPPEKAAAAPGAVRMPDY